MPVDKTWGILDLSDIHTRHIVYIDFNSLDTLSLFCLLRLLLIFLQSNDAPRLTLRSIIFSSEPVLGLMAEGTKTVTPAKHGGGKGLMIPPPASQKKPPVLLREDPKYALEKLSSIIGSEDYKDLGNHSTEAMGETGLFSITQVSVRHTLARIYILCLKLTPLLFRPCS